MLESLEDKECPVQAKIVEHLDKLFKSSKLKNGEFGPEDLGEPMKAMMEEVKSEGVDDKDIESLQVEIEAVLMKVLKALAAQSGEVSWINKYEFYYWYELKSDGKESAAND